MSNSKVNSVMLLAIQAQTELFVSVEQIAGRLAPVILERNVIVRHNYWGGWEYRSVLLSFDLKTNNRRPGFHPYGWFMDYRRPEVLIFRHRAASYNARWQDLAWLNLTTISYFNLEDQQKIVQLETFIRANLNGIREISKQY